MWGQNPGQLSLHLVAIRFNGYFFYFFLENYKKVNILKIMDNVIDKNGY